MNRITFIDSAKGVSMLLIVAAHLNLQEPWPYAYDMMVPIFFILSGCFFKPEVSWNVTIKNKFKRLLIPFIIIWVLSYTFFYLLRYYAPSIPTANATGIFDCFTQHAYFNGPLWFLPCLFFVHLIVMCFYKYRDDTLSRIVLAFGVGYLGYWIGVNNIYLPLDFDIALTATPFYCIGYECYHRNLFSKFKLPVSLICCAILLYVSWQEGIGISMSINSYNCHYISMISAITIMSVAVVALCKAISEKLKYFDIAFSYVGRNSMWILCTHHLIYRPFKVLIHSDLQTGGVIVFIITMAVCLLTAPLVDRYFPILIGKKRKPK